MNTKQLWLAFRTVIIGSFSVLAFYGRVIYPEARPVPERVVGVGGHVPLTDQEIRDGQNVGQSMGGQEVGSVWGQGADVASDWSADGLHPEAGQRLSGDSTPSCVPLRAAPPRATSLFLRYGDEPSTPLGNTLLPCSPLTSAWRTPATGRLSRQGPSNQLTGGR